MRKEIEALRACMYDEGMDAYYIPSADHHNSEYFHDHFKACEFLSGFTGEAADMLVTEDGAYLWTDSRFFIQAEQQLAGSGIELMKMRVEGVPTLLEFLKGKVTEHSASNDSEFVLGFDGSIVPAGFGKELEKAMMDVEGFAYKWDEDLVGRIWNDRPAIRPSRIWEFPVSSAGQTAAEKVDHVRTAMRDKGADYLLLTDLMETAWLLNLRGDDIAYTPVFYSYVLLSQDEVSLYIMDGALEGELPESLQDMNISAFTPEVTDGRRWLNIRAYDAIYEDVRSIPADSKVWLDSSTTNETLYLSIQNLDNIIDEMTPVSLAKTVKNETEISNTIKAHVSDGIAVTRFIKWIKEQTAALASGGRATDGPGKSDYLLTEISAADYLEALRREEGAFDISFETISGYGPNGAIVHYAPSPETDLEIRPEGFLLVDSGGQYIGGTSDITRTIAVGPLTKEMIDAYTRVLKGHIALSRRVITPEVTHKELDACTRESLAEAGLSFGHGVSHGVGHVLGVHEGPAGIRNKEEPNGLRAGMIITDEPGYYKEGEYGIRIENEILLAEDGKGNLVSTPITLVPYERLAINTELLTGEEIAWVDEYHARVRETLTPLVDAETAAFIEEETRPL